MGEPPEIVPAGESRTFRLLIGALGSALCLMPLVALARPVGLIGLPPHGKSLVGDVVLLVLVLAAVGAAVRAGWPPGRNDSGGGEDGGDGGGGGGGGGGRDWSATHEYPLFGDPYHH
jgi:hypothetical protein